MHPVRRAAVPRRPLQHESLASVHLDVRVLLARAARVQRPCRGGHVVAAAAGAHPVVRRDAGRAREEGDGRPRAVRELQAVAPAKEEEASEQDARGAERHGETPSEAQGDCHRGASGLLSVKRAPREGGAHLGAARGVAAGAVSHRRHQRHHTARRSPPWSDSVAPRAPDSPWARPPWPRPRGGGRRCCCCRRCCSCCCSCWRRCTGTAAGRSRSRRSARRRTRALRAQGTRHPGTSRYRRRGPTCAARRRCTF